MFAILPRKFGPVHELQLMYCTFHGKKESSFNRLITSNGQKKGSRCDYKPSYNYQNKSQPETFSRSPKVDVSLLLGSGDINMIVVCKQKAACLEYRFGDDGARA
jgi:hypothetical protein